MTRGPQTIADDGAGVGGAGRDERAQDHHALRHRARRTRRGRPASCTSTTACGPAWSDAMATGPGLHSQVVALLKLGLPLVAVGLLAALFLVQTDDSIGGGVVFSRGDVDAAGRAASGSPTRPSPAPPAATTASASPPRRCCRTARRRRGRRSPGFAGTLELKDGPVVTPRRRRPADLHIPTQRLDMTGAVTIDDLGRLPDHRGQGDARPQGRDVGRRRRVRDHRSAGADHLRQPDGRAGGGRRASAAVLFRKRRQA